MQLALELPQRASFRGEDFFVAPSNCIAVAMIDRWPDWPSHALAVVGPRASGKSHLAAVWQVRSGARNIAVDAVGARSRLMMHDKPSIIVEDADQALADGRLDPVDLFHLYNWIRERQGFLLLSGLISPARWETTLPDLRSRLSSMPIVTIEPPGDSLLAALMVKRLADRQLRVDPRLVEFVIARTERSFSAIEQVVAALDRESLAQKRPITIPLARTVMTALTDLEDRKGRHRRI